MGTGGETKWTSEAHMLVLRINRGLAVVGLDLVTTPLRRVSDGVYEVTALGREWTIEVSPKDPDPV